MNPDVHTLTGAYALDALDDFERRLFEAHLAECPDCAREVDELRATAARLGIAVAEQPPEHLRRRVLHRIATTRQDAPVTRGPAVVRPPRRWVLRVTAVAAVVAVAAAVALGVVVVRTQDRLDGVQGALVQEQARYGPVAAVFGAHDARAVTTVGPGGGTVLVLASRSLNRAVLLVTEMPPPPAGHAYQAWLLGAGSPRPAGLLRLSGTTVVAPLVLDRVDTATMIGVTVEPDGGSAQPTTSPVMTVAVPA